MPFSVTEMEYQKYIYLHSSGNCVVENVKNSPCKMFFVFFFQAGIDINKHTLKQYLHG